MAAPPNGRLDSWKEIADYLRKDASTVMRWARDRGLPVHRVPGGKRHAVFAYPQEIDAWLLSAGGGDPGLGIRETATGAGEANGAGADLVPAQERHPQAAQTRVGRVRYTMASIGLAAIVGFTYFLARPTPQPRVLGYAQLTNDGRWKDGQLVTDGARLYFGEDLPSGPAIVQVPTAGGEPEVVSAAFRRPLIQDLSRSRAELLVSDPVGAPGARAALWALSLSGGSPRRVGNILTSAAGYSPDGARIAYGVGEDLYVSNNDGSNSRKIATLRGQVGFIRWAPDGRVLRLTITRPDRVSEIWEMRPDGSELRPFLAEWQGPYSRSGGQWNPNERYFFFATDSDTKTKLWLIPQRGGLFDWRSPQPVHLNTGPLTVGGGVPSVDGQRVFFGGLNSQKGLFLFDPSRNEFSPFLPGISANEVNLTGDGRWVAYVSTPGDILWKRRSDGNEPTRLLSAPMQAELPRWSPDGKCIAFMARQNTAARWQACVIPADGGEPRAVLPSSASQGAPTWSPDGRQLMFGELFEPAGRNPNSLAIHVVNLQTGQATTLPGSQGLWTARWSPDGKYAAALTADSRELRVYDFHSRKWTRLTSASSISDLNWSHQGDAIYFEDSLAPEGAAIFRVHLRDQRVEKIAGLNREPPIYSPWFGLSPDDTVIVSNLVGTSEIYALDWEAP